MMKNRWFKLGISVILGSIAGYAYYYFIGCKSGTCAITSNPLISTGYGALIGGIWSFPNRSKKSKKENSE